MFEYQVSISIEGRFFFRTDWDHDKINATKVARSLISKYGVENVRVRKRSLVTYIAAGSEEINEMLK